MVSVDPCLCHSGLSHLFSGDMFWEDTTEGIRFKGDVYLCFAVWCLIHGASVAVPDVAVRCAEEVLLPCKVLWDSSITYQTASWYKVRKKPTLPEQSPLLSCLVLACLVQNRLFYEEASFCQCSWDRAAMKAFELIMENRNFPCHCRQTVRVWSLNCSWPAFRSNYCWLPGIRMQVIPHIQPDKYCYKEECFQDFSSYQKMVFKLCNISDIPWLIFHPNRSWIFLWNRSNTQVLAIL